MLYRESDYRYLPDHEYAEIVWKRIEHFKKLKHTSWKRVAFHMNMSLPNLFRTRRIPCAPKAQKILALSSFLNCSMDDLLNPYKPLPPIRK